MPTINGVHAMNPGVARRKAAEADADDSLIPDGHELDEIRVKPAENGFTVNHTTRPKPGQKPKGKGDEPSMYDYRGKDRVFESHEGAAGHVLKVMAAHRKAKGKK